VKQTGSSASVIVHATSATGVRSDTLTIWANGTAVLDEPIDGSMAHDYTRNFALALSTADVWTSQRSPARRICIRW